MGASDHDFAGPLNTGLDVDARRPARTPLSLDALAFDEAQLDLLADLLADRLAARFTLIPEPREALVDAREIARLTGRSRAWVYEHARQLGAVRLGSGPRPRLGFHPERVLAYLESLTAAPLPPPPPRVQPRRRRSQRPGYTPSGVPLLPICGRTTSEP